MKQILCVIGFLFGFAAFSYAGGGAHHPITHVQVNTSDKASLQRGARLYMNYCASCHALSYSRFGSVAQYIGVVDEKGSIDSALFQNNLILNGAKMSDPIKVAMDPDDARQWFGLLPPDLTLVTRVRGADWVYTYLKSFYRDPLRPWGANNALFPDVGMPNVLLELQGEQIAIWDKSHHKIKHLQQVVPGQMSAPQFDSAVADLVNFLSMVAEPSRETRLQLGYWVLLFLLMWLPVLYALKRSYWRDIK